MTVREHGMAVDLLSVLLAEVPMGDGTSGVMTEVGSQVVVDAAEQLAYPAGVLGVASLAIGLARGSALRAGVPFAEVDDHIRETLLRYRLAES